MKFKKYASLWWENTRTQRRRDDKESVRTWSKLKKLLTRRFLPASYKQDLYLQLNALRQGTKSVEEYTRDFELLLMRCDLQEQPEQKIARYLNGLQREIAHTVELQQYKYFEDVCKLASKVEKQRKALRLPSARPYTNPGVRAPTRDYPIVPKAPAPSKPDPASRGKEKMGNTAPPPARYVQDHTNRKCFKCQGYGHFQADCPNRRVMTVQEIEAINLAEKDEEDVEERIEEGSDLDDSYIEADEGELLVLRRALHAKAEADESQRENLFHTRCTINGKVCSMIIDGGSCTNVASTTLVDKLGLPTIPHPTPYNLRWLNEKDFIHVGKQVLVPFSIGKRYTDEILCDILPMSASHILLGRPWEFDKRVNRDGHANTYTFKHGGKSITLAPLPPSQVRKVTGEKQPTSLFLSGTK